MTGFGLSGSTIPRLRSGCPAFRAEPAADLDREVEALAGAIETLAVRGAVAVGALPDMLTFDGDGRRVLVANEGEPVNYLPGAVNPEGSVSIIDLSRGVARASALAPAPCTGVSVTPRPSPGGGGGDGRTIARGRDASQAGRRP